MPDNNQDIAKNINKNNDLANHLAKTLQHISQNPTRKIPPVDQWQPTNCSPLDITICDNGEWWHEGAKMTRQSLVDLFASVLWVEMHDGQKVHYLKTPTDKYQICVVDAPLFINRVEQVADGGVDWIVLYTTHGDAICLDDRHRLYFADFAGTERLYIDTRFGLTARLLNNAMYHLVELGELVEVDGLTALRLTSGGKVYQITQK
ncbi:DUF1285 domain-containing protein [Moraxella sp. ZJ142]|uniref:DUF1285 domain-containing protein n=1 Tax=Moraxella marmotae TaxID=3344520 RepID=UPI0035D46ABE